MNDAASLFFAHLPAWLEVQRDRCTRGLRLAHKQGPLGHHEVHARASHAGQVGDGTAQLSLEGAVVFDLLRELTLAKTLLIEDLETHT